MALTKYIFSIQNDFPYHKVNSDHLKDSILKSTIGTAIDSIDTAGDNCNIWFVDELTQGEQATLTIVCTNHNGETLPTTNSVEITIASGTILPVSGKGTGGYFPDPSENPVVPGQDQTAGLLHDGDGNTRFRGPVLSDEGSFRDDFTRDYLELDLTGTVTFENGSINIDGSGTDFHNEVTRDSYIRLSTDGQDKTVLIERISSSTELVLTEPYTGSSGSGTAVISNWVYTKTGSGDIDISDSCINLKPGTVSGNNCGIHREGDYQPLTKSFTLVLSQRVVNQKAVFGFSDTVWGDEYEDVACLIFEGTDNTKITFITSCEGQNEESEIQLDFGLNTDQKISYLIEITLHKVSLSVAPPGKSFEVIKEHHTHIPRPYTNMYYGGAIWNTGTVVSETTIFVDNVCYGSHNVLLISNSSKGDALEVKTSPNSIVTAYIRKKEGPKITCISPNWCDKTSWYPGSIYVSGETVTDSGNHALYTLAHGNVIDNYHGKITFEDYLIDSDGYSYRMVVKVDNVVKTEQDPHLGIGGDYTIDYVNGSITFLIALQGTEVVKADYHYASTSAYLISPITGKNLIIDSVEVQCSEDCVLNDSFYFQAYGLVEAFAPQLMGSPYNIPLGTKIPLGDPLIYKTLNDIINDSNVSHPLYPAFGGGGWRSLKKSCYIFTFNYPVGSTILYSKYGMELRIKMQHDVACGGTYATASLYATSEDI